MTIKELKELIKDLPDETEVRLDYEYIDGDPGWSQVEQEDREVVNSEYLSCFNEFHLCTYKE